MIRADFNRPVGAGTEVMRRCRVGLVLRVKVQKVRWWWNLNVCSEMLFWIPFCISFYLSTESLIDSQSILIVSSLAVLRLSISKVWTQSRQHMAKINGSILVVGSCREEFTMMTYFMSNENSLNIFLINMNDNYEVMEWIHRCWSLRSVLFSCFRKARRVAGRLYQTHEAH